MQRLDSVCLCFCGCFRQGGVFGHHWWDIQESTVIFQRVFERLSHMSKRREGERERDLLIVRLLLTACLPLGKSHRISLTNSVRVEPTVRSVCIVIVSYQSCLLIKQIPLVFVNNVLAAFEVQFYCWQLFNDAQNCSKVMHMQENSLTPC